jgi:hypothetical protein
VSNLNKVIEKNIIFNISYFKNILNIVNHNRELFDKYIPIYNYGISAADETGIVLESNTVILKYDCFRKCSSRSDCLMISYKIDQCKLYSQVKYTSSLVTNSPYLFEKVIEDYSAINANLIHHWPMNNNYNDIIGGKTLTNPLGVSFISDRLNYPLSALSINNGYIKASSGVYFSGDFTVTSWFKSDISLITQCRLFDFGNAAASDNVLISWNSGKAYITTFAGASSLGKNRFFILSYANHKKIIFFFIVIKYIYFLFKEIEME